LLQRRWLPGAIAVLAVLLFSHNTWASDGPLPRSRSSETSAKKAPRLFIANNARSLESTPRVATSRGSKRNSKLQWRSVRKAEPKTIQPTAHEDGPIEGRRSGSVLKNAAAAPLPNLNPLDDPFADRLAAQPSFDDDNERRVLPPLDDDRTDSTLEDLPATRTPAEDRTDPFPGEPRVEQPIQPDATDTLPPGDSTTDVTEDVPPAVELDTPSELPTPSRPMTREELKDKEYREDLAKECAEGLEELRIKTLLSTDLQGRLDISEKGTVQFDYPVSCPVDNSEFEPRNWDEMYIAWTASGVCHKPLYFEERHLERYGHSTGPYTQPFVSMAHFFGSVAVLPYSMGLKTPNECVYALGHYRPGSCAPYIVGGIPFTPRAALFQAGAVVGTAAIIP